MANDKFVAMVLMVLPVHSLTHLPNLAIGDDWRQRAITKFILALIHKLHKSINENIIIFQSSPSHCKDCPAGYYCPNPGTDSIANMFKCPAGYYCPSGSTVRTNQSLLFRSREWSSANQGPVFPTNTLLYNTHTPH